MKVRLLGTAAGGGVPQWNCACDQCLQTRKHGVWRAQECCAVSGDGRSWYLLNASPDLGYQLPATAELTPGPGVRDTPLRGVLLTDGELDHTLGLFSLRQTKTLTVYATAAVHQGLAGSMPLRSMVSWDWPVVSKGAPFLLDGGLRVNAITLGRKRPGYTGAAHVDGSDVSWVVCYRIADTTTGGALVYAPCLAQWSAAFDQALIGADCLLLDGTFFTADEMAHVTGAPAASMGHLPIADTLPQLARHRGLRCVYTHLNNTNPVLSADSAAYEQVVAAGAQIAVDGLLLEL